MGYTSKVELLAPAGNLEKLKIALAYGADAVYLAGQRFGLRSGADNFSLKELKTGITLAKSLGVRVYITLNGLLHEEEMLDLKGFLVDLAKLKPDACIVSDPGVMAAVREAGLPIHVSTQASTLNSETAAIYKNFGAKRLVLARELSLPEAKAIQQAVGLEVEMFAHGALCMSYSGQCTISNFIAGRDANRGGCIQSCRHLYHIEGDQQKQSAHYMSSKDLSGLRSLKDFVNNGITSAKIEGRMKSGLYLATVLSVYRSALDALEAGEKPDWETLEGELKKLPHRDYTEGSLSRPADKNSVYNADKESPAEAMMAGQVLALDAQRGRFLFQPKNRLLEGDVIELIPKGQQHASSIKLTLQNMTNVKNEPTNPAQPNQSVWLPLVEGVFVGMVGRIALK